MAFKIILIFKKCKKAPATLGRVMLTGQITQPATSETSSWFGYQERTAVQHLAYWPTFKMAHDWYMEQGLLKDWLNWTDCTRSRSPLILGAAFVSAKKMWHLKNWMRRKAWQAKISGEHLSSISSLKCEEIDFCRKHMNKKINLLWITAPQFIRNIWHWTEHSVGFPAQPPVLIRTAEEKQRQKQPGQRMCESPAFHQRALWKTSVKPHRVTQRCKELRVFSLIFTFIL